MTTEFDCLWFIWEKTPTLRKCQFLKKQSNGSVLEKGSPGRISDPSRTLRELRDCAVPVLCPGLSGHTPRLLFSLSSLQGCPHLGRFLRHSSCLSLRALQGSSLTSSTAQTSFMPQQKYFFGDGKSISFPSPFLNSKSEQTHLLFPSCCSSLQRVKLQFRAEQGQRWPKDCSALSRAEGGSRESKPTLSPCREPPAALTPPGCWPCPVSPAGL